MEPPRSVPNAGIDGLGDAMESVREEHLIERVHAPAQRKLIHAFALLGVVVFAGLLPVFALAPALGLRALWFLCIPLAPMFLLAAPNLWVSLCPLSSLQRAARALGWNGGTRLSPELSRRLQLVGWLLMFLGIPSRHVLFNTSGPAMLAVTAAVTIVTLGVGFVALTLSGWCMGACPIRPVEVIYGQFALDRKRPTKCGGCDGCVSSCVRLQPEKADQELGRNRTITALAQAFPGFVAAYFLIDFGGVCTSERAYFQGDVASPSDLSRHAGVVYAAMAVGSLVSFGVFHALGRLGMTLGARFKAVALSAYCFYYVGVAPEIAMAWSLDPSWSWCLLIAPAAVLSSVLFLHRRNAGAALAK